MRHAASSIRHSAPRCPSTPRSLRSSVLCRSPGGSPFSPPCTNASQQPLPHTRHGLTEGGRALSIRACEQRTRRSGCHRRSGRPPRRAADLQRPACAVRGSSCQLAYWAGAPSQAAKPEATKPVEGVAVETEQQPTSELLLPSGDRARLRPTSAAELVRRGGFREPPGAVGGGHRLCAALR